jgi:DNA-binding MarR family transcriptional regulator
MKALHKLNDALEIMERKYGLDVHKIRIMILIDDSGQNGECVLVGDILRNYKGTSRLVTHTKIHQLVTAGIIQFRDNPKDRREKQVVWGARLAEILKDLDGV